MNNTTTKEKLHKEIDRLSDNLLEEVYQFIHSIKKKKLSRKHRKPTIADLLDELAEIKKIEPVDIEIPARQDRFNPTI